MPSHNAKPANGADQKVVVSQQKPMRSSEMIAMYTRRLESGHKVDAALRVLYTVGTSIKPFEKESTEKTMARYEKMPEFAKLVKKLTEKFADLRRQEQQSKRAAEKPTKKITADARGKRSHRMPLRGINGHQLKGAINATKDAAAPKSSASCQELVTPLRHGISVHAVARKEKLPLWMRLEQF